MKPIELTEPEQMLLGIKKNELGFATYVRKVEPAKDKTALNTPVKKPEIQISPNFSISASPDMAYRSLVQSPMSPTSPATSPFNTSSSNASVSTSSWLYNANSNSSGGKGIPGAFSHSTSPTNALRKRNVVFRMPEDEIIKDSRSLKTYLDDYEELESKLGQLKDAESKQSTETSWNVSSSSTVSPKDASSAGRNSTNYQPADDSFVLGNWTDKKAESEITKPLISRPY